MIKNKTQWKTGRVLTYSEQVEFIVNAKREQDYKNNPNFESKYYVDANNHQAVARGCSLNLIINGHRFT